MFEVHHWTCTSVRTFVFLVGPALGAGDVLAGLFVFLVGPVVTDRPWFSTVTHGQAEIGAVVNVVVRNGAACLQLSAGKEQPSHLLG